MKKNLIPITIFLAPFMCLGQWTTVDTDASGDSGGLDGTTLEYQYDQSQDEVSFRITTTNLASYSSGPAADFSFQLPNGLESGNAAGTHWTSNTTVHKTAYIYCDAGGSAPSNYTFGTWALRIEETSTQNVLCSNCVTINADVAANQITYVFKRKDIISDAEMGASNSATITLVHNVGHDVGWDDNVTETGTFMISMSGVSLEESVEVAKFSVYPSPAVDLISVESDKAFDQVVIYDFSGKKVKEISAVSSESIDVADLKTGEYILTFTLKDKAVGNTKFVKQ